MFGITNYVSFILASVLLNIIPGADTIYILTKSMSGGRGPGIASALGISSGILIHTTLAALGLSAILATSATAFTIMKALGAAYLLFMGIRTILKKGSIFTEAGENDTRIFVTYRQGVITNVLNPKAALFFLALLPQYVLPDSAYGPIPFLLLGLTFVCTSTTWSLILVYFSSFIARILNKNEYISNVTNKVTGGIYIILGLNVLRARLAN